MSPAGSHAVPWEISRHSTHLLFVLQTAGNELTTATVLLVVSRVLGGHLTLFLCSPLLVSDSASSDDLFKTLENVFVLFSFFLLVRFYLRSV